MKVPKRISELIKAKQDYIDAQRGSLEKVFVRMQTKYLNKVFAQLIPELDIKDGVIQETDRNYRLLRQLDVVYKDLTSLAVKVVSFEIGKTVSEISGLSQKYFSFVLNESLLTRFEKVVSVTNRTMAARIGLRGGQTVSGGFIDSIVKDNAINTQVKDYVLKSITGQVDQKDFIKGMTELVTGSDKPGLMEKQYQRYGYDLYQQYDRAYSKTIADEFDLNYFLYQGGLIDDSRDFCVAHNNKVWTREEAADWDMWKPYMGDYPAGYEIKQKDIYDIPSYLGYAGYQPLIDFGGYRCRHSIGWISDELAYELRPELKGSQ